MIAAAVAIHVPSLFFGVASTSQSLTVAHAPEYITSGPPGL
ncbi:MAG: hypothetical protein WA304_09180 [Candidatus Cybelea sp.]